MRGGVSLRRESFFSPLLSRSGVGADFDVDFCRVRCPVTKEMGRRASLLRLIGRVCFFFFSFLFFSLSLFLLLFSSFLSFLVLSSRPRFRAEAHGLPDVARVRIEVLKKKGELASFFFPLPLFFSLSPPCRQGIAMW